MPRADGLYEWKDYENKTLVHNHMMAKIYKKRYQRAADFQNTLYRFFGLITVVSSTVASTLSWGMNDGDGSTDDDSNPNKGLIVSTITTISAVAAAIQNFYKFQETRNVEQMYSRHTPHTSSWKIAYVKRNYVQQIEF